MAAPLRLVLPSAQPDPALRPRTVLLVMEDPRLQRSVTRVMRASHVTIINCVLPEAARACLDQVAVDLVIYDYDLIKNGGPTGQALVDDLRQHPSAPPIIVLSEKQESQEFARFLDQRPTDNVVAKIGELDDGDLLVTARKLLENDIFGIEKYLRWGSVIHDHTISSTDERSAVLKKLEEFLVELQCQSRLVGQLLTVADELMMNALYDAPTDGRGRFLFADLPRTESVVLPAGKAVDVAFGSDGRSVAIGCRDPFGSLEPMRACASLARCLRGGEDQIHSGAGGAGLGLYMVFQFVSHLVINVDRGRATEFLGIIDITSSARQRRERPRSLNIFTQRP